MDFDILLLVLIPTIVLGLLFKLGFDEFVGGFIVIFIAMPVGFVVFGKMFESLGFSYNLGWALGMIVTMGIITRIAGGKPE